MSFLILVVTFTLVNWSLLEGHDFLGNENLTILVCMIRCTGISYCINKDKVFLSEFNYIKVLEYYLNNPFLAFWWLFTLKYVFLVRSDDGDCVDYLLIVNIKPFDGGYIYFGKLVSSWCLWNPLEWGHQSISIFDEM